MKKWLIIVPLLVGGLTFTAIMVKNSKNEADESLVYPETTQRHWEGSGIEESSIEESSITEKTSPTEENLSEEMMMGDAGNEIEEYTVDDKLIVPEERAGKAEFQDFVLEYANTQNYTKDGFHFGYADKLYEDDDGVSDDDSAAMISGMGNAGYLVWLFRNTFGYCDLDFQTPFLVYQKSVKIEKEDLQVGDLAFVFDEDREDNFCGVFIGWDGDVPVFTFMDGSWSKKFPFGNNRLCYLKDDEERYIGESSPVQFRYFCRPDLPWKGSGEGNSLSGRVPNADPTMDPAVEPVVEP